MEVEDRETRQKDLSFPQVTPVRAEFQKNTVRSTHTWPSVSVMNNNAISGNEGFLFSQEGIHQVWGTEPLPLIKMQPHQLPLTQQETPIHATLTITKIVQPMANGWDHSLTQDTASTVQIFTQKEAQVARAITKLIVYSLHQIYNQRSKTSDSYHGTKTWSQIIEPGLWTSMN